MNTLPTINHQEIEAVTDDPAELIYLLVTRYRSLISADESGQIQNQFSAEQNILMAFEIFDGQVCNGGFIQLIENGYGAYIFDSPFSTYLGEWGLVRSAALIDRARVLYEEKKEVLEKEKTLAEFAKLYQQHPEFDPLDKEFYDMIDEERELVKEHILLHIDRFALIQ
jgi:hypothetical protein